VASVVEPIIRPDVNAIAEHLRALFDPLATEYPQGLIEISYGFPGPDHGALFGISRIDDAVTFAAEMNADGKNVYVGVNPRKPGSKMSKRASDSDVEIAVWQFADIDKSESVEALKPKLALLPNINVITGRTPNPRPHLYWLLDEPVHNLAEWSARQQGLAAKLGGDPVINPSRIMRLAGTVNYPTDKKMERGYRTELATLKVFDEDERPPVPVGMFTGWCPPAKVQEALPVANGTYTPTEAAHGGAIAGNGVNVASILQAIRSGDQWHNNVVRLVAHLATRGRTEAEILGLAASITLPGFTVDQTIREMRQALDGARRKWAIETDDAAVTEEDFDRPATFELLDMDALENMPPPSWLIDEMISDHGLTILYGDPGAGKSFIALDMALRLSFGMDWHGTTVKPTGVLYIAGEGARGIGKRVKGWRKHHGLEGADAPFLLLPVAVQLLNAEERTKLIHTINLAKERAGSEIGLVVIDTVSRALAGADENAQNEMSAFVDGCATVQRHIGGAVIGVHHSGKDKDKGMRGSTVLLGACDSSIRVSKEEQLVTIKTEKQKDAEEASPIYMKMEVVEWAQGLEKEQSTLVPVKAERGMSTAQRTLNRQQVTMVFDEVERALKDRRPWSPYPQAERTGRYLPVWVASEFDITEAHAAELLSAWQTHGFMETVHDVLGAKMGAGLVVRKHPATWDIGQ
jgi:RecA-family ATPase